MKCGDSFRVGDHPEVGQTSQYKRITNPTDESITSGLPVTRDLDAFRTCAEKNLQGFEMGWRHYELTQGSSLSFVSPCRYFLGGGRNLLWIWAMTT
jgi:hypothetical protein